MCGICGIVDTNTEKRVEKGILEAMTRQMAHRGPDDEGYHIDGHVGLGHRRLSIIDTKGGNQPMTNEDRSLWLVYNGEIYNFIELTEELKKRGHRFSTRCDTEVILHLYEDYGPDCLAHLRGMFAFAIWDARKRQLFCARDRLGQKPLYYSFKNGTFVFASSPAAILCYPGFQRRVDLQSLDLYLTYQYIPSPHCIFDGVSKLPPASCLTLKGDDIKVERYWDVDATAQNRLSYGECHERLRELLSEATRLRLVSDVPLGAFLSGGIDSSIIVALMSSQTDRPVKTFSIGFEDRSYNELPFARLVARSYSTDHHEFVVRPKAVELLPKLVWHYGEPFADSSALATYYVAEQCRRHVTVALNGDAGDELFAGYPRYLAFKLSSLLAKFPLVKPQARFWERVLRRAGARTLPGRARRFIEAMSFEGASRYLSYVVYFSDSERERLYGDEMREAMRLFNADGYLKRIYDTYKTQDDIARILLVDLHSYLPEDLLVKVDIATMANSLEARSPFLDHRFVEFAASLPVGWKLKGRKSKYILKDAFSDQLPAEIIHRGKMGFGVPVSNWFRGELMSYIQQVLLDPRALSRGYFNRARVEGLVSEHVKGIQDHGYRLWALLVLELWHREFIDSK